MPTPNMFAIGQNSVACWCFAMAWKKNYAEQIGADTLRQILTDAEEHLAMEGFKPGADGLRLTQLFGKA